MIAFADIAPPLVVGVVFTSFAGLKFYGLARRIEGGSCKPIGQRVCGTCPDWKWPLRWGAPILMLVIGLANLGWAVAVLLGRA